MGLGGREQPGGGRRGAKTIYEVSGVQVEELQEGDQEMEEVEEIDNGVVLERFLLRHVRRR